MEKQLKIAGNQTDKEMSDSLVREKGVSPNLGGMWLTEASVLLIFLFARDRLPHFPKGFFTYRVPFYWKLRCVSIGRKL